MLKRIIATPGRSRVARWAPSCFNCCGLRRQAVATAREAADAAGAGAKPRRSCLDHETRDAGPRDIGEGAQWRATGMVCGPVGRDPELIAHEELKRLTANARAVVRTGECTPYANIVLIAGVTF